MKATIFPQGISAIASPALYAGALLAEFSRVRYWDANTGQYVSEPPTILIGSEAGADFIVENVSDQYLDIGLFIVAFDPFGNSLGATMVGPTPLAPGGSLGGWDKITTESPGTYTFTVDIITSPLIPYGIIGTLGNIPIAYVVGEFPPLSGYVYEPLVFDSTTGETFYSAYLPAEIDGGHRVIVGIHWMNDGGETATFKPTFELIDPDGISREAQTFTTVLSPSQGTGGQTGSSVELNKAGIWKIHAILKADGTLLDEETWNAISVTTFPPPAYKGSIVFCDMYKATEGQIPFPATVIANNEYFKVFIDCKNTSTVTYVAGVELKVYDPDGLRASPTIDWANISSGKELEWEYRDFCRVDKVGAWTIQVRFLEKTTLTVLAEKTLTMKATSVVYAGTISKKQLTYDSTAGLIPVTAKVSQGTRGIVTVLGRNDMATTQQMGIIWSVKDPEGYEVEHYSAWEAWPYNPPGGEHKFDGGRFDLDKPGRWTIEIALYMNHDDPVIVNSYTGTLCQVEAIEYAGTISKKQFKYDSVIGNIPVAKVSQGMNGVVTAWGRNDMAAQQQLGMRWEVRGPDGYVMEQYPGGGAINWEYGYTGPGDTQDFIGGRFDLNKLGGYTIFIELFMNPTDPVVAADYDGLLCTVQAPEYAGTIISKFINKSPEGFRIPIPTEVAADNNTFEVGVKYKNLSGRTVPYCGCKVEVWDPDGILRASPAVDWTGLSNNEERETQYNICPVDKAGDWTIHIEFLMDSTVVVASYDGLLFTAVPAFPNSEFREGSFVVTGYDGVPVDEQLMVMPGQTATVHMTVDYRGPAIDGGVYTAIGWKGMYFLPTFSSKTPVHFDASYDFTPYEFDCDVDIKTLDPAEELAYGTLLDMYAKIVEVPGADIYTPFYIGVIAWSKPPEAYELIQHTVSHFAYIYDGDAETTTVTLKTSPFNPADWVPDEFIAELEREARESGVRILETKVYVDTSPLLWTDFKIEVIGTPSGEVTEGVGVSALPAIPLFVKIIVGILLLAFAIYILTMAVKQFLGVFDRKVGLESVKPAWGKEALILDIRDAEWYWERTLTPTETLEGMSEEELRDMLDQIAEEEVPPGLEIPWALVAVGGLGVLGVGAALALASRRKE